MLYRKITAVAICAVLLTGSLFAEDTTAKQKRKGPFADEIAAFREKQQEENKAFRKTLKDMETTAEIIAAVKEHRTNQHKENVEFEEGLYQKRVTEIKSRMTEKGLDADKQKEILALIEKAHNTVVAAWKKLFTEAMTKLNALAAEELTKKELVEKVKVIAEGTRDEFREIRKSERVALKEALKELRPQRQKKNADA